MALPQVAKVILKGAGARALLRGESRRRTPAIGLPGMTLTVRSNIRAEVQRISRIRRDADVIIARALNLAATKARTQTVRRLSTATSIPQKTIRKRVKVYKATRNKKPLRASLWVGTKRPVKAKELGGTVSRSRTGYVKVGKRIYRNAFPARMPGGHEGIFSRKPHARHRRRPDGQTTQLPIEEAVAQLEPEAGRISRQEAERAQEQIFPRELRRLAEQKLKGARF